MKDDNTGQRPAELVPSDHDASPARVRLVRSLLRRLELTAMTHNRAALAIYEKAGFGQAARLMLRSFNDGTRKSIR